MCLGNRVTVVGQECHQRAERAPWKGYTQIHPEDWGMAGTAGVFQVFQIPKCIWGVVWHLEVIMKVGIEEMASRTIGCWPLLFPTLPGKQWEMTLVSRSEEQVSDVNGINRNWNSAGRLKEPRRKRRRHSLQGSLDGKLQQGVSSSHWLLASDQSLSKQ